MLSEDAIMTLDQLHKAKIDLDMAREAYSEASTLLADIMATKNGYDNKACALLGGYVAVSLALTGGAAFSVGGVGMPGLSFHLLIGAIFFAAGGICFLCSLIGMNYGNLGSAPAFWLQAGVIDGGPSALPTMLAYLTHHYNERIRISRESNAKKEVATRIGIILGAIAPIYLAAIALFYIY